MLENVDSTINSFFFRFVLYEILILYLGFYRVLELLRRYYRDGRETNGNYF